MKKVSVLIVAKNEANHIRECIESCRFDKEVIVIDDHSTDNTAEIAESLGAKVFRRHLNGDFGAQKTFAIEQAGGEWVFLIDADERCTPELSDEISKIVQTGDY
ncbi:glycosyltransferase family 2 protein, partial [Enterobacter hormaechei subsp. steigerwaltii]|nr:glycosyltransferase family 2 protein [Enterobacter hormaechei subsp. steigerwaltii]